MNPALTIIDGIMVMDGPGPISGRTRPLGWLIGGINPMACEIVCAKLVNIEPKDLPIVQTAEKIGFGCLNPAEIEIAGDNFPQEIYTDFELPEMTPIRFSFLHVCKSICKQIILIAKETAAKVRS